VNLLRNKNINKSENKLTHLNVLTASTSYSGLALDVQGHMMYVSDEGQGQVLELDLNYTGSDLIGRIIHDTVGSKPQSLAIDTTNRLRYIFLQ